MELRDRLRRETDWQEKAFRIAGRHRARLADALGTPPDLANVPDDVWRDIENDWAALLILMLIRTALENSSQHGRDASTAREPSEWASATGRSRASDFTTNTRRSIETKAAGWQARSKSGTAPTRQQVETELEELLAGRAAGLIETEFTAASVWGGEFGTALSGLQSPDDQWKTNPHLSASGPCPVCEPLHGRPRSEWESQFPGGPPAHPRCCLPGTVVAFPTRPIAAFRSIYRGEVVQITVSRGGRFAVTKNHPVLTTHGFVPAGSLNVGDDVVGGGPFEGVTPGIVPDDHQIPALAEDVFAALLESLGVVAVQVPAAAEQFHGDGAELNSDVHVVLTDRKLRRTGDARRDQPFDHLEFCWNCGRVFGSTSSGAESFFDRHDATTRGRVGGVGLPLAIFGGHAAPDEFGAFGTGSPNAKADQVSFETSRSGDSKFGGEVAFRFPRNISVNDVLWDGSVATDSSEFQPLIERDRPDPEFWRKIACGFPGKVSPDRIVEINESWHDGPVYDFEVDGIAAYSAGGVIVHNCVCEIVYVRLGQPANP